MTSTTPETIVLSVDAGAEWEELGSGLYANYTIKLSIAGREIEITGWRVGGWLAPGASADLDGSGLAQWGSNQPGGWSECEGDGQFSGDPEVEVKQDRATGAPILRIISGQGGPDTTLTCADVGIAWPDPDGADDDQYDDIIAAAEAAMQALRETLADAIEAAIPGSPAEPSPIAIWYALDAERGAEACPVRVGDYLGTNNPRVVVCNNDRYTSYHPDDAWEDDAREAAADAVVAMVRSALAASNDNDREDDGLDDDCYDGSAATAARLDDEWDA